MERSENNPYKSSARRKANLFPMDERKTDERPGATGARALALDPRGEEGERPGAKQASALIQWFHFLSATQVKYLMR